MKTTLKTRLLISSLMAVVVTCTVLILFSVSMLKDRALLQTQQQIRVLAHTFANLIGNDLARKRDAITSLAKTIEQYPDSTDIEQFRPLLQHTFHSLGFVLTMYGNEQGGMVRQDADWDARSRAKGYDPRKRSWYVDGARRSELAVTSPYISDTTGDFVVTITYPVHGLTGQLRGVAGANLSVTQITAAVRQLEIPGNGYAVLVENNTHIISHPDKALNNQTLAKISEHFSAAWLARQSAAEQLEVWPLNGSDKLVFAIAVPDTDWSMVFFMDKDTIMATYTQLSYWMAGIGMALLLLFSGLLIWVFKRQFVDLERVNQALQNIADGEGDLTVRIQTRNQHDEIGQLAGGFNRFVARLQQMIAQTADIATELGRQSQRASQSAKENSRSIAKAQDEVTMVATAVTEMASATQEIAGNAEHTAQTAQNAVSLSAEGTAVVGQSRQSIRDLAQEVVNTSRIIEELNTHSQQISSILLTIRGVAEQTNLLALNAAIEAARAGEHGRGFAVVADEVRVLSQRTHSATQEIQQMIETLQLTNARAVTSMAESHEKANASVTDAEQASLRLEQISLAIDEISDMARQIATAAEEQTSVTEEISRNTESIREVSGNQSEEAELSATQAQQLARLAEQLKQEVSRFKC